MTATENELRIVMMPGYVRFKGTRAQLEAEGLIPAGTEYPSGKESTRWQLAGMQYVLGHGRPQDAKGQRSAWANADCWHVEIRVVGRDWRWHDSWMVQQKRDALAAEIQSQTAEGRRASSLRLTRWCAARDDDAFQAFKMSIPGLAKPKRGRRPTNAGRAGAARPEVQS